MSTRAPLIRRLLAWLVAADDGVDPTDYVRHVERAFGVRLSLSTVQTLGQTCAAVGDELARTGRPADPAAVWETLRRVASAEFGVDAAELHAGTRYVEDLCC